MKKRLFLGIGMGIVASLLFNWCAIAAVTIRFWATATTSTERGIRTEIIKMFEKENPDIHIKFRALPTAQELDTILKTAFVGGNPPEFCTPQGYNYPTRWAKAGLLIPTTDWLAKYKERFIPGIMLGIPYEGELYGIPGLFLDTVGQVFYNKDILDKYGIEPPQTWRMFLVSCQKLKDNGVIPIALGASQGFPAVQLHNMILAKYVGAEKVWDLVLRKPGNHWTNPDVVQAARLYQELADLGFFPKGAASDNLSAAYALFFGSKAAYMHCGSWLLSAYRDMAPPGFNTGVMDFPTILGGRGPRDANMEHTYIVPSISLKDKTDAGWKFLEFVTRKDIAKFVVKKAQRLSCVRGVVTKETAEPHLERVAQIVEKTEHSFPWINRIIPEPLAHGGPLYVGAVAILTGDHTAESWMEWVETEAQKYEPIWKEKPSIFK